MIRRSTVIGIFLVCCAGTLSADFTYEQSSKVTGGMMAGMMKFAGAFSKQAREPMRSTVMVKGDRMAMISGDRINVIDLGKETFTDIDMQKKTYAVITFADMMRAMQKASEKVKTSDADISFTADVKNTGATKQVLGFNTKQTVLTLKMEGTDKKSGKSTNMDIVTDMWLTPTVAGYEEVRDFYTRMAQKMSWAPNSGFLGALAAQQPGMSKGMSEVYKEMQKLDGIPVLQVVRMGGSGAGMTGDPNMAATQQQQQADAQQAQQQPAPTPGDAASSAAAGAAASKSGKIGAIAGGLGGFGGFGRKKKPQQEEQPSQAQQAPAPAAAAPSSGSTPPGTLIELTTEITSFSAVAVDGAKLEVPAGFKQVEHDMAKALR